MTTRTVLSVIAVAAVAGAAQADKIGGNDVLSGNLNYASNNVGVSPAGAFEVVIDVSGIESWDPQGAPVNTILEVPLGANAEVVGLGWDVSLEAFDPSWLSEMTATFNGGLTLTPGTGDDFPGVGAYSSGGIIDLIGEGLNFNVGEDGNLVIEFWESFDDFPGGVDGLWTQGSITVQYVPAPAGLGLLAIGGLVAARRRR